MSSALADDSPDDGCAESLRMSEPEFCRLGVEDISECIALAVRSFDHFQNNADAIRHWFEARIMRNPWQASLDGIGVGVRDRGKLVAFRAMFAQPWWIEGRSTVIAFAAHTCIEPAYRGARLGSAMIANSRAFADLTGSASAGNITQKVYSKQGFVAVGGESNDFFRMRVSYVGSMQKRLGEIIGKVVGGAIDAVSKRPGSRLGDARDFRLEECASCSGEFDDLWTRARSSDPSGIERSSVYLNWRLFDQPTLLMSLLALRDSRNNLRGYGIWHELRYSENVSCAVLRDLFVADDDEEARCAFMVHAMSHWRSRGISWASLEVASPRLTHFFESQGYERLPSKGNRYHVYSKRALRAETLGGWFRSGLDGDYFDTRNGHA